MDAPEEEDRRGGDGGTGDSAARQLQESSPVFGHFGDLYPLDFVEPWLQTCHPGPETAASMVGEVKPLLGSTLEEQAMEDPRFSQQNAFQGFNASHGVDWHQTRFVSNQELYPHNHAACQHLHFDALMPRHSSTPRSHGHYTDHNHAGCSSNHAGNSSELPPPSLPNLGHSLLSNGGLRESSSWQQNTEASKMPFQYPNDQETLIQMSDDWQTTFAFSNLMGEVSDPVGYGQHGDGATDTLKNRSSANLSKLQDDGRVAEPNLVTPRRRERKKVADALDDESCKRCNCRKSQCLQLYCECFAAGLYCIESCACEGCYNKLDFEDIVDATRRPIISCRPLAFGPKVVKPVTRSPSDKVEGNGSEAAPSSARHKRGCNCKKSRCLKRYCECYQGKAGCSHECNCENCCNPFSPKSAEQRVERREMSPYGTQDSVQGMLNTMRNGTGGQSALAWEGTANMLNSTPSLSLLAYSNRPNTRGCSSSQQVERYQGTMPLHLPCSPPSDGDKALLDLISSSTTHDLANDVTVSDIGNSSLSKMANASSPDQGKY